jgi:hypothetical protein
VFGQTTVEGALFDFFRYYANWLPFMCHDARFEDVTLNYEAEVLNLARHLSIPESMVDAHSIHKRILQSVAEASRMERGTWDGKSGFSSEHVEAKPAVTNNDEANLKIEHYFGGWLDANGYRLLQPENARNTFVAQLSNFELLLNVHRPSGMCPLRHVITPNYTKDEEMDYFRWHFEEGYHQTNTKVDNIKVAQPVQMAVSKERSTGMLSSRQVREVLIREGTLNSLDAFGVDIREQDIVLTARIVPGDALSDRTTAQQVLVAHGGSTNGIAIGLVRDRPVCSVTVEGVTFRVEARESLSSWSQSITCTICRGNVHPKHQVPNYFAVKIYYVRVAQQYAHGKGVL